MTVWSRVFSTDPLTKTRTMFHHDQDTDQVTLETVQDVEDIVELNAALKRGYSDYRPWATDNAEAWHHVGVIPNSVMLQLHERGILKDARAFAKWWNSEDAAPWRAHPGRL